MTTPDLDLDEVMPRSYVAIPAANGGSATIATGGVYIPLPMGVSTVQLTWWGSAYCHLFHQPSGSGGSTHTLINLPTVSDTGHRSAVIQVAVDNASSRMYVQTGGGETSRRVGVIVIPTPAI